MSFMYSKTLQNVFKKKGITIGDAVKIRSKGSDFEGILMPRPDVGDENIIVIKLRNGYNIGIRFDADVAIERSGSAREEFSFPKGILPSNADLPKVTLLYTGGTIGSKIDYATGGVYMLTKPEELLYDVPELSGIANIKVKNVMSIASEDMTYHEWQKIAEEVASALNGGARGVVITHGTDTMHFTSAVLSFMLQGANAPIVITGSQRSSDRGSSDAFMNLICSAHLAAKSDIAEVGICMHYSSSDDKCAFIRGTKARKMHTSRRDAFRPINSKPIAFVTSDGAISYNSDYKKMEVGERQKVVAKTKYEPRVALVKIYPNSDPGILDFYAGKKYKGIILEGTGLGHAPVSTEHKDALWLPAIKKAVDAGIVVGMTSQCLYGRVNTNVYRNLRLISSAGVIYCEDMLPETALVKLGWLLGNYSVDKAKDLLNKNIAGEISERSDYDEFLI
ncbi:MAG: Glu-tRNA(Gln) amidotransferase subunit GatD [Candidatus Micrarchaeaceae archaeon]